MNASSPMIKAAHRFQEAQRALFAFAASLVRRRSLPGDDSDEFLAVLKRNTDAHSQLRIEEAVRLRQLADSAHRYKLASDTFHELLNKAFQGFAVGDQKRIKRCYTTFQNFLEEWNAPPRSYDEIRAEVVAHRDEIGKRLLIEERLGVG